MLRQPYGVCLTCAACAKQKRTVLMKPFLALMLLQRPILNRVKAQLGYGRSVA